MEPAEVEICLVDLTDPELNAPYELASDERAIAARQSTVSLARRYTASRVALRRLLAMRLGIQRAVDIALEIGPLGKPRLIPHSAAADLRFSLSRTAEFAIVAVAEGIEVGIDIEQLHPFLGDAALMEHALSASEQRAIETLPAPQRPAAMGRCWVRKEAVLKALGTGLANPLTGFAVERGDFVDAGSVLVQPSRRRPARVFWRQLSLAAQIGFAAVACVDPG
jgi:4'-phosphopantetheinyl transferase